MKKVILVTPHMPPTAGGPSIHAKKLLDHFSTAPNPPSQMKGIQISLFNFEKYKKYPSGIRHLLAFFSIFKKSVGKDTILALDGFTVALPSIFVGKILRKKVIIRVGGDFIYEQFLNLKQVDFLNFYKNFNLHKKFFSWKLYLKYLVQKFVLQNADEIIFNTSWQRNIFQQHYKLSPKLYVVENPVEAIESKVYENAKVNDSFLEKVNSQKYIFTSITRDIPYKNLKRLKKVFSEMGENYFLETEQGSRESCLKRISLSRAYICASISDISPNQVQEALSLKIPIIISKYTGITEYIEKQGVAKVVDPFDENDIKNALLEMCDESKYLEYKKNLENFKWPQTWESLFEQYKEIL